MLYLLGDQTLYFPSSDDQSYSLKQFLQGKFRSESHLPVVVRIKSVNISSGSLVKQVLTKNTPLLLLDVDQFHSLLAEFHPSNDRRYTSNRSGKLTKKFLNKKKTRKSLVTFTDIYQFHDEIDDDLDVTRTIVRSLNGQQSSSTILCRVPIDYRGYFELLNENDQSVEPYHRLSDFLLENEKENRIESISERPLQSFFLRSSCVAFTKRSISNQRKLSASADSCYGSLSDLESQRNLCVLNEQTIVLQPGQIITILNPCTVFRSFRSENSTHQESSGLQTSTSSWWREKSRWIFPKKTTTNHWKKRDISHQTKISDRPETFLKSCTENGEIFYLPLDTVGLFSPLKNSSSSSSSSFSNSSSSSSFDISTVFQLKQLIHNFRFPLSVRLLDKSIAFDDLLQPATTNNDEFPTINSSTKLRLLVPYSEQIVFACPLISPSSFKSQPIVIPIPINAEIEVQRCLNMREIAENSHFHQLIQTCFPIIQQYQKQFSLIHFPLILSSSTLLNLKRKPPLFKKRSRSESALFDPRRKSDEFLPNSNPFDVNETFSTNNSLDRIFHRDSFQKIKDKIHNRSLDCNQPTQTIRRSAFYAKLKTDRTKRSSTNPEIESEDENYREIDEIYDFIRSGDLTEEMKRIQKKAQTRSERELLKKLNPSMMLNETKTVSRQKTNENFFKFSFKKDVDETSEMISFHRFPHDLDDSRPYSSEVEDDVDDEPPLSPAIATVFTSKPVVQFKQIRNKSYF